MRILTLSWEYPPKSVGGLARHVYDLTKELARQEEDIFLLTCGVDGAPDEENVHNVRVFRTNPLGLPAKDFVTGILQLNFSLLKKAVEIIQDYGPFDIIHAHDWLVAFAAWTIKHAYRIPLVSTIHATEYGRNQGLHNDVQRYISDTEWWLTYESWRVIVCSHYMKNELQNIFQLPDNKLTVVPNGVDPNSFSQVDPGFSRRNYAADDEKIVFFVGRLVPEKGVEVLLDAAPKILHYCPEAKFIIAGKGPSEEYLKQKAHMINIDAKVYFTGYIDDSTRNGLYRSAQAAVFPSTYEPFGIVALEAMAAQTPVIVSDVGGLSEIISHGIDGLKVYGGNPNSLADNIIHVLKSPDLGEYMKKRAFEKVTQYFNWDKISRETRQVYRAVQEAAQKCEWKTPQVRYENNFIGRYS
ncbi:MAG: glycosyltransferase family 4 protein [Bacillota bacterium]|jgi:glycogen(starch) synthase|nr:glycosyltransferase family 4 protein [Clostridia bacterium]